MRKYHLVGYLLLLLIFVEHAQSQGVPKTFSVSFRIPINTLYKKDFNDNDKGEHTHTEQYKTFSIEDAYDLLYTGNDTVEMIKTTGDQHDGGSTYIKYHLVIDTVDKIIKDLSFSYFFDLTGSGIEERAAKYVKFHPLKYFTENEPTINLVDSDCIKSIDSAYYFTLYYISDRAGKYQTEQETITSLRDSINSFVKMDISFDTSIHIDTSRSVVKRFVEKDEGVFIIGKRPLQFRFPSLTANTAMCIYDILGREVYREEIPPSVDEWVIDWRRTGQYFVSLGNQSAKFIYP